MASQRHNAAFLSGDPGRARPVLHIGEVTQLNLADRRVAVVGLAISNLALIRFLVKSGAKVTAFDQKTPDELGDRYHELQALGAEFSLGPGYLSRLPEFPLIFLTPGMKKDFPEIQEARARGAEISSETRLFFSLCPAPVVGITGSAGKTTTTTLIGEILKAEGHRRVLLGGNSFGKPPIEWIGELTPDDLVVLELSSFQLQLVERSPHIGALLNISPNHLDVHSSMEEYAEAKKNIFRFQNLGDWAVFNYDRPETRGMVDDVPGGTVFFSRDRELKHGAFLRGNELIWRDGRREHLICNIDEIILPGRHNLENILAATAVSSLAGASPEAIRGVVTTFKGVEHRLELVRELDGVRYYNDSIATAPDRTLAALETFRAPIVLIAGGYDKKIPFEGLAAEVVRRVNVLILIGATADKIAGTVEKAAAEFGSGPEIVRAGDLSRAVAAAREKAQPGDVVLLSPSCASYDQFRNFEERGRQFKGLVAAL